MKIFFLIIFFIFSISSYAQTIEELESNIGSSVLYEDWNTLKVKALELLEMDKFNKTAIDGLLTLYYEEDLYDSISFFWVTMIDKNPENITPYLLRVEFSNYEGLTTSEKITYLKLAYSLDKTNEEVNYLLGLLSYDYFIDSNSIDRATISIKFLSNLCQMEGWYKGFLKTPLIQLSNYLNDSINQTKYSHYPDRNSYFPLLPFANLKEDWETDYGYNVFYGNDLELLSRSGIEDAQSSLKWYSKYLSTLKEPIIYDTIPKTIYRFTWLRSFNHPIVIRVETNTDVSIIYWKMGNEEKIIKSKSRKLSSEELEIIKENIESLDFFNVPTTADGLIGIDGARWILEVLIDGEYHVVDRWSGGAIKPLCLELLNLTKLKIKNVDLY